MKAEAIVNRILGRRPDHAARRKKSMDGYDELERLRTETLRITASLTPGELDALVEKARLKEAAR